MHAMTPSAGHAVSTSSTLEATRASSPQTPVLLSDAQRQALVDAIDAEFWQRVRSQVRQRPWPGRLKAWDVSPEGRVLAGVQTRQALVWLDAGPKPVLETSDPRLQRLLADRQAREALWRKATRPLAMPAGARRR